MYSKYKRLRYACYTTNLSMSVVGNLSPLLFLTFYKLYNISFSLLGTLVFLNFCTQLAIDLVFSFYSNKFNISKVVKFTPVLTAIGLFFYALAPVLFPNMVYVGLVIGTIIFAASGGLAEVLISPVIAAVPSDNPEREMSKLHSVYAWGVVFVVIISTLLLLVFGREQWPWLAIMWMIIPLVSAFLFFGSDIPALPSPEKASHTLRLLVNRKFLLCFFIIFFGGASECIMAQWSSSYLEQAFQIPKVWGDVMGVAMFALALGLGRSLYAKYGKKLHLVLFSGAAVAFVCYLTAAVATIPVLGLIACAFTGFCVSMLWPGSLLVASSRFPTGGVVLFALMAAGGDLGGSVGPQIVGVITDTVMQNDYWSNMAVTLGLTAEQVGMKAGMLFGAIFPLFAAILLAFSWNNHRKQSLEEQTKLGSGTQ